MRSSICSRPATGSGRSIATDHAEYVEQAHRASELVEQGNLAGAAKILGELVSSEISDVDKAMMCLNLAVVADKRGRSKDAVAWYEKGEAYERPLGRFFVAEHYAAYLAEKGKIDKSIAAYEAILGRDSLSEDDKERVRRNIEILRNR